ncbi:V-type ATP synthase subunit C [Thermoplasmatales archaeon]|nr:V-type ATP synthase subunit C [Thermoplasmatales archaeon]
MIIINSGYSGSYGKVRVNMVDFLPQDFYFKALEMSTFDEITQALSGTSYKEDIDALSPSYSNPELLEMAINRHLLKKNRLALATPPPMAIELMKAYFSKWDIENIKSVISSKLLDYKLKENETFLMSFRDIPLGLFSGNLTHEDFVNIMSLGTVREIFNYLAKFGYGTYLLQFIGDQDGSGAVSPLFSALDDYYYSRLFAQMKFVNGDEGPLFRYFAGEIDRRNIMLSLKARVLDIKFDIVKSDIISGGFIPVDKYREFFDSASVDEMGGKIKPFYDLEEPLEAYRANDSLNSFDTYLKKINYRKYMPVLRTQAMSLGSIFSFIFTAEKERENLRAIVMGKAYSLRNERIREIMTVG